LMLAFTMCSDGGSFDVTPDGQVRESDQSGPSSTQRTERPLTEAPLEVALGETRENVDPVVQKLFFLTHHKTGTFLMSALGRILSKVRGERLGMGASSRSGTLQMLQDCRSHSWTFQVPNVDRSIAEAVQSCPSFRAVHLIRDPLEMLASAYIYHLQSSDTGGMRTGPRVLRGLSLEAGLQKEARVEAGYDGEMFGTLPEMAEATEVLKTDPRVLSMDLAEFERDFTEASHRLFVFLLGSNHVSIPELVASAASHDVTRWSEQARNRSHHIAAQSRKEEVRAVIERLRAQGDVDILRVESYRQVLGFS